MAKEAIYLKRVGHRLIPASRYDAVQLERFGEYQNLKVEISERRSSPQNRMYWAILSRAVEITGRWPNKYSLHKALLVHLGFVEVIAGLGGAVHIEAKSAAFDKMDQAEFREYFDHAMRLLSEEIGLGVEDMLKMGGEDLNGAA